MPFLSELEYEGFGMRTNGGGGTSAKAPIASAPKVVASVAPATSEYDYWKAGGTYEQEHGTIVEQQAKEAERRASDPLWYIKDWINAQILKYNASQTNIKFQTISGLGREVKSSGENVRGAPVKVSDSESGAATVQAREEVYRRPSAKGTLVERGMITQEGGKTEKYNIEVQKMTGYDVRPGGWNWLFDSINNFLMSLGLQPIEKEKAWLTPEGKVPEVRFLSELEDE